MANIDRKFEEIEWCGKKIKVQELVMTDILHLTGMGEEQQANSEEVQNALEGSNAFDQIKEIAKIATGLEVKEIISQPPSKIKELMIALERVNADFFWIANCFGIDKAVIRKILRDQVQDRIRRAQLMGYMNQSTS